MHRSGSVLNAVRVTFNTLLNNADADTNIIVAKTNTMDMDVNPNPLQKPSTKRKANEDINPLLNAAKRSKKDKSGASGNNKRKLNGVEDVGGLRIVRAPSSSSSSARPTPDLLQTQQQPIPPNPPTKKFRASPSPFPQSQPHPPTHNSRTTNPPKKDRSLLSTTREDPDVDEDVRMMENEAEGLRRLSIARGGGVLAGEGMDPAFRFPVPGSGGTTINGVAGKKKIGKEKERGKEKDSYDTIEELSKGDTPQMARNKLMRAAHSHPSSNSHSQSDTEGPSTDNGKVRGKKAEKVGQNTTNRKSSGSTRGKRVSSLFEGGVISQPHTQVSDSSFYKHIDHDLPESDRARQLLIWCSNRALGSSGFAPPLTGSPARAGRGVGGKDSEGKGKDDKVEGKSLPPLSEDQKALLRGIQEDAVRMLAERKIDLNVISHSHSHSQSQSQGDSSVDSNVLGGLSGGGGVNGSGGEDKGMKKPNEQNERNRAREVAFSGFIEKAKAEENAWLEVANFYNSYRTNVLAELDKQLPPSTSAKAKGKQRATSQEVEEWSSPREYELPEVFRGGGGVGLARGVIADAGREGGRKSPLSERLEGLEFKVDSLHSYLNSALQTTNAASDDLDARFSLLSLSLAARSQSFLPSLSTTHTSNPLAHPTLYRTSSLPNPNLQARDPQDLLRALSRLDAERPPAQVGDQARRAVREVQRVNEGGGVGERRLTLTSATTGVGATPRKAVGTPRRGTPGKER
ncbi:hypothetical protein PILCRDRAFT_822455 [Piloderma croceum F 1598]|uniref:Uncharacterized protein n=1 Tax=Piloderma croceum (strain F 1598) TaxID=765440 RepID=A0A0C3F6N5_PILCF|nr:hypothetical protein PILCRDRAFT_822455 [Piloderma croceum F 1598]